MTRILMIFRGMKHFLRIFNVKDCVARQLVAFVMKIYFIESIFYDIIKELFSDFENRF